MSEIEPFSRSDFSRRRFMQTAGGLGLLVATYSLWKPSLALAAGPTTTGSGTTPEQVHLTWPFDSANNPTNAVVVSWLQPQPSTGGFVVFAPASNPGGLTGAGTTTVDAMVNTQQGGNLNANSNGLASGPGPFPAAGSPSGTFMGFAFSYQDRTEGSYVYAYSAVLSGLLPNTAYVYAIGDGNGNYFPTLAAPAAFTTAPAGRTAFTFSSYGDLGTPTAITSGADAFGDAYAIGTANDTYSTWAESSANAYQAVNAVEYFAPLFHLINGDLSYADKNATQAPEVWRDFGMSVQRSAMNRPWMPCLGNHEAEVANGYSSYLSRYVLPDNGAASFPGNFYYFQVGSVLIISLDANDVVYQDSNAYASTTITGSTKWGVGGNCFDRYYTGTPSGTYAGDANLKTPAGNAQTEWLQNVLASARPGQVPALSTVADHHDLQHRPDLHRLDRGADAPMRHVVVVRQRLRQGDPGDLEAAVRPVPGRPGGERARSRLRTLATGSRVHPPPGPPGREPIDGRRDASAGPGLRRRLDHHSVLGNGAPHQFE